jgi:hypothetical protein
MGDDLPPLHEIRSEEQDKLLISIRVKKQRNADEPDEQEEIWNQYSAKTRAVP